MAAEPLRARIALIDGKYIFLNKGSLDGVKLGDVFEEHRSVAIIDPETDEDLGQDFTVTAELWVEVVEKHYCKAIMTFAERLPHFIRGDEVVMGHSNKRVTATGTFIMRS